MRGCSPRPGRLHAGERVREEDRAQALGHPLEREERGDDAHPVRELVVGEEDAGNELEHDVRGSDDRHRGPAVGDQRGVRHGEQRAGDRAERQHPRQRQPAAGRRRQRQAEHGHGEHDEQRRLQRARDQYADHLAREVGRPRHRRRGQAADRAVVAFEGDADRQVGERHAHHAGGDDAGHEDLLEAGAGALDGAAEDRAEHDQQQHGEQQREHQRLPVAEERLELHRGPGHGRREQAGGPCPRRRGGLVLRAGPGRGSLLGWRADRAQVGHGVLASIWSSLCRWISSR